MLSTEFKRTAWLALAISAVMCVGLRWEGRRVDCACDSWQLWITDINSSHCSQHFLDAYSFTHYLHGFLFFGVLWWLRDRCSLTQRFLACVVLEAGWELLENTPFVINRYRTTTMALGYEGDSIVNSLGDLASCGLGFWSAAGLTWRWTVGLFLAIELILLLTIRDSLLLNVVMLLWPLEALKQWQMGA